MSVRAVILALLLALAFSAGPGGQAALGTRGWMPETGEFDLEEVPRDTPELRRKHAFALIGTGQWAGGVAELRKMIDAEPAAPWVGEARLAVARALLGAGKYREAFDEAELLQGRDADERLAAQGRELQFAIARMARAESTGLALSFCDRLFDSASTSEEAARAQKVRGDTLFAAGRYLDAEDQYSAIIELHPRSSWTPYCWFKVADCEWHLARWLKLGLERLKHAERSFADFIQMYPRDEHADDAKRKLDQTRQMQAALHGQVARFYIEAQKRPWAAVNYLELIVREFGDTAEADWAARELDRIRKAHRAPLRGDFRKLELAGVGKAQARAPTEAPSAKGVSE